MKKGTLFFISFLSILLCFSTTSFAYEATIVFSSTLGGSGDDIITCIIPSSDGGYISAGYSNSNDKDIIGNHGGFDALIIKYDINGNIIWNKVYGGSCNDYALRITKVTDGYVFAGRTESKDDNIGTNKGISDVWLVKISESGDMIWQKTLGGSFFDGANSIEVTSDGGFVIAGYTASNDQDVNGNHSQSTNFYDMWIVKMDSTGNIQWQKCYGGKDSDIASDIQPSPDGGYIVSGWTHSRDEEFENNTNQYYILKLDSSGNKVWSKFFGGNNIDKANSIRNTIDGGFITAGYAPTGDGDVTNHKGMDDFWIVKMDSSGNMQWEKSIGGSNMERCQGIVQGKDGTYLAVGYTYSRDQEVTPRESDTTSDFWVAQLLEDGSLFWQQRFGSNSDDGAYAILESVNGGGYVIGGYCGGPVNEGKAINGGKDAWFIKIR